MNLDKLDEIMPLENLYFVIYLETRLDTWLPKSRAGGQGSYLRSLDHLGRSSGVKKKS